MKKLSKKIMLIIIIFVIISMIFIVNVHANNKIEFKKIEYSEAYKRWLELPEEERNKTFKPFKYNIRVSKKQENTKNILKVNQKLKADFSSKFDLRDVIKDNMVVRNQMNTSTCWAFATLGSLESNLAYKNYRNQKETKIYDFSEMHMNYSTTRNSFLEEKINENGINRNAGDGGNLYNALMYLSNGNGAIKEEDMPYEDTTEKIDISRIQNKEVLTTLNDMNLMSFNSGETEIAKNKIKEYIKEYGGIAAQIHGDSIIGKDCYNNETGAIYCDNATQYPVDHAILIVGWDDMYSKENFNENKKPTKDGAWIIKNSWGEKLTYTSVEFKNMIYETLKQECIQNGWNTAQDIPNEAIDQLIEGSQYFKQQDGSYALKMGDNGFMYISYEDANIYSLLWGIQDSKDEKELETIYKNDEFGPTNEIQYKLNNRVYIANVFKKSATYEEEVNKVSVFTVQEYKNCKVYINPNGKSRKKEDLQEAKLKLGDNVNILPGYRTLEFSEPIKIKSNDFSVVLEFQVDSAESGIQLAVENDKVEGYNDIVKMSEGESYFGIFDPFEEIDTSLIDDAELRGNVCLRAYTQKANSQENPEEKPEEKPEENPGQDSEEKILSDFSEANAKMTLGKINIKTDDIENSYVEATIIIDGIKKENKESKCKYSYYLSTTKGDKNIKEEYWINTDSELKENSDGTYLLTIVINNKDLKNYNEITSGEKLYIYLREKAIKDNKEQTQINEFEVKYDEEPEIDIDGKKENPETSNDSEDTTIAPRILPFTGIPMIITIFMIISIVGIFAYIRYKNIDK